MARCLALGLVVITCGGAGCPRPAAGPTSRMRGSSKGPRTAAPPVLTAAPQAYHRFLLAQLALGRGDVAEARRHLRAAAVEDPGSADLRLRLAELWLHDGQARKAWTLVRQATRLAPDHVPTLLLRARLLRGENPRRARTLLARAEGLRPQRPGPYLARARFERWAGEPESERQALRRLLRRRPEDTDALFALANLALRQGRWKVAGGFLDRLRKVQPFAVAPWLARARLWITLGRPARAARVLLEALEATADDLTVARELFRLWRSLGQRGRARDLITLLQVHASAPYLTFVAELQARLGRWSDAFTLLGQARKQDPQYGPAVARWAQWLARRNRRADALTGLTTVPVRSRAYPAAWVAWATLVEAAGDPERALRGLRRATTRRPRSAALWEALALLLARRQRLTAAERALERARVRLHLARSDPAHRYTRVLMLEEAGRFRAAMDSARRLLREDPGDAQTLNLLGYSLADRGIRLHEASRLLRRAQQLDPLNPYILDSLGWALYQQRRFRAAIPLLERAVKIDGWLCEAWHHLGDARRDGGLPNGAAAAYRAAWRCSPSRAARAVLRGKLQRLGRTVSSVRGRKRQ